MIEEMARGVRVLANFLIQASFIFMRFFHDGLGIVQIYKNRNRLIIIKYVIY